MIDEDSSITVNGVLFISVKAGVGEIKYVKEKCVKALFLHTN